MLPVGIMPGGLTSPIRRMLPAARTRSERPAHAPVLPDAAKHSRLASLPWPLSMCFLFLLEKGLTFLRIAISSPDPPLERGGCQNPIGERERAEALSRYNRPRRRARRGQGGFCVGKFHFPEQKSSPSSFRARKSAGFQRELAGGGRRRNCHGSN